LFRKPRRNSFTKNKALNAFICNYYHPTAADFSSKKLFRAQNNLWVFHTAPLTCRAFRLHRKRFKGVCRAIFRQGEQNESTLEIMAVVFLSRSPRKNFKAVSRGRRFPRAAR
jgi:hypothetical protein